MNNIQNELYYLANEMFTSNKQIQSNVLKIKSCQEMCK